MTEPCDLSAVELRALIGARKLSPVELVESCLRRIAAVNGTVNAFVALDEDGALARARELEAEISQGRDPGPLAGLPVGIKDLVNVKGVRTTYGSLLFKDHVPDADDGQITRLRDAGAIILGKTNTPEFGSGANTTNRVYGATTNPFDPARTPGGSSGGSAAALACSMVPLAQGSDTGGSLRAPATWSGVVGFRPRPGAVANERRLLPLTYFSVQGPMGRSVADTALLYSAQAGSAHPGDPMGLPFDAAPFADLQPADLGNLRVAFSEDLGTAPVDDGIKRVFRQRSAKFRDAFAHARDDHPDIAGVRDSFWVLRCVYYMAYHKEKVEKHRDLLSPNIVTNTEAGYAMSLADVAAAEVAWRQWYDRFQAFMEDVDLLILPGNAYPPYRLDTGAPTTINGKPMENYMDASLIRSALTLTGNPVIAVPCGLDETGAPFGFQIAGKRHGEKDLLEAALAIETILNADAETARPIPDLEKLT
ncbi:amidase [Thalassospiraceae bacterium LMO-SO8]|nr:amidase [Alphaproteobacteria bacterium LMO-S08]WND76913.1 amidase [Thalassospiraceae bacterium LMO-SO8]